MDDGKTVAHGRQIFFLPFQKIRRFRQATPHNHKTKFFSLFSDCRECTLAGGRNSHILRLLSGPSKGGFKASCSLTISRNHKTKKFVPFVLTAQCLDEAPILWLLLGASKIGVLRSSDLTLVMDFPGGTSSLPPVFFCPYLLTPPPMTGTFFVFPTTDI